MKVEDLILVQTCDSCPEQYDVYCDRVWVGYIRYRNGVFSCQPVMQRQIQWLNLIYRTDDFNTNTIPDNLREEWLNECKQALTEYWNKLKGDEI